MDSALSDLEELSTDALRSLAQTTPVDYYESNIEDGSAVNTAAINSAEAKEIEGNEASVEDGTFQETWATYDYDTAPDWAKENILIARYSIVYCCEDISWTVNGAAKIVNEDGSLEDIPEFSELFPYWDLQQLSDLNNELQDTVDDTNISYIESTMSLLATRVMIFNNRSGRLPSAGDTNSTSTFSSGWGNYTTVGFWAGTLPFRCTSYNVGAHIDGTGDDFVKCNLLAGQGLRVETPIYWACNVIFRVSTYSQSGYGLFSMDYEPW